MNNNCATDEDTVAYVPQSDDHGCRYFLAHASRFMLAHFFCLPMHYLVAKYIGAFFNPCKKISRELQKSSSSPRAPSPYSTLSGMDQNIDLTQNQKKRSDGWLLPRAKSFALLSFHMVLPSFDATSFLILPSNLVNWFFCYMTCLKSPASCHNYRTLHTAPLTCRDSFRNAS